ncbi:unnamed protein product [Thelazia callipaeda]|uniref:I/LWEQ domain-containing protein n=1 Tax=Thelazia callipaeda TaxID=103827 RepID=A0A0N5CZJ3_THECL|nr:unnamed protein product [Thelazia callipaeda]
MFSKPETLGVACSLASRIGDDLLINPEGIVASSGQGRSLLEKDGRCQVNKESPASSVNSVTETTLTMVKVAESMVCDNSDAGKCKLDSVSDSSSDVIAQALMRSAEALQRLAERKSLFDRATSLHDADECFADFVCSSLKSIDNSSRVHARIAILHALAQFQK